LEEAEKQEERRRCDLQFSDGSFDIVDFFSHASYYSVKRVDIVKVAFTWCGRRGNPRRLQFCKRKYCWTFNDADCRAAEEGRRRGAVVLRTP